MRKGLKITAISIASFLVLLAAFIAIYAAVFYKANKQEVEAVSNFDNIIVDYNSSNYVVISPNTTASSALIFYPGGKVEHTAYIPLGAKIAAQAGIKVIIVRMPLKIAVLNVSAAEKIMEDFSGISSFYIGGHSLGGAMASSYFADHSDAFAGLILVGAYPTSNCSKSLCIYGENDKVLDIEKTKLAEEIHIIKDGNHAYFGNYGEQEGDGIATITRDNQQEQTALLIANYIEENTNE